MAIPSQWSAARRTLQEIDASLSRRVMDERTKIRFMGALYEAVANGITHGNGGDPEKVLCIRVSIAGRCVTATVTDAGQGFDPSTLPDPRASELLFHPRGRGVFLMKSLTDQLCFNAKGNAVTFTVREP